MRHVVFEKTKDEFALGRDFTTLALNCSISSLLFRTARVLHTFPSKQQSLLVTNNLLLLVATFAGHVPTLQDTSAHLAVRTLGSLLHGYLPR